MYPNFFYIAALVADQKLRYFVGVVTTDVGARDVLVGQVKLVHEVLADQEVENAIDRRRGEGFVELLVHVINQLIGGSRLVGPEQTREDSLAFLGQPGAAGTAAGLCMIENSRDVAHTQLPCSGLPEVEVVPVFIQCCRSLPVVDDPLYLQ